MELWGDDILQALRVANIDMVIIIGFVFGKKLGIFQQRNWENFEFFFSSVNLIYFSFSLVNSRQNFDFKKNEKQKLLPIWIQCQKEHTILPQQVQTFQCCMIILF